MAPLLQYTGDKPLDYEKDGVYIRGPGRVMVADGEKANTLLKRPDFVLAKDFDIPAPAEE